MGKKKESKKSAKTKTKQGPRPRKKKKPGLMTRKNYLKERVATEVLVTLENGIDQVRVRRMTKIDAMKMNAVIGVDKEYLDEHGEMEAAELIYANLRDIAQVLFPRVILEPDVYPDKTKKLGPDDIRISDFSDQDLESIFDWSSTGGAMEAPPEEEFRQD